MKIPQWILALSGVSAYLSSSGCQRLSDELARATQPSTLRSKNGLFELALPAGWKEDSGLHEQADLGAAQVAEELYVVVLSENADDFQTMTLSQHSETTRAALVAKLQSSTSSGPTELRIDGQPALQHEICGVTDNVKVCYLHTTVLLGGYYHQILAWTLRSRFAQGKTTLQKVVDTLHTVSTKNPPQPAPHTAPP